MEHFKSFITEEKSEDYRLIVLSNKNESPKESEYFHTAERFIEESKSLDIPSFVLFVESGKILDGKAYQLGDKKGFEISSDNTLAIVRGAVAKRDAWMDMVSQLEKMGISCVNSRSTVQMCSDKYWTALRLADSGVPTPKTALVQNEKSLQESIDVIGDEYP